MDPFLDAAFDEAVQGLAEGGIPIGSVLVIEGRVVGRGHNRRFTGSIGLHHVHHLAPRIPNYRLQQCYDAAPLLQVAGSHTSLWDGRALARTVG